MGVVSAPVFRSKTLAKVDLPGPAISITTLLPDGEIATWVAASLVPNAFASSASGATCAGTAVAVPAHKLAATNIFKRMTFSPDLNARIMPPVRQDASSTWRKLDALVSARAMTQPPLPQWAPHDARWIGVPRRSDLR